MRKNTNRAIEFYFRHICGFEDKPRGPGGKLVDLILPPYRRSIASPPVPRKSTNVKRYMRPCGENQTCD